MNNQVLLSIKGLQFDLEENGEEIESIVAGIYEKRDDQHVIIYDELLEGYEQSTQNQICFKNGYLALEKSGYLQMNMIFDEKTKTMTNYETPYGDILIGVQAKKISVLEQEKRIMVEADYALEMNYEHLADYHLVIDIRSKEEGIQLT